MLLALVDGRPDSLASFDVTGTVLAAPGNRPEPGAVVPRPARLGRPRPAGLLLMLLIRLEVCPEGDVDRAYTIGVGVVGRVVDPDHDGVATYVVALTEDGEQIGEGTVAHDQDAGPWRLVADAVATALAAGGELPPVHVGQLNAAVARSVARAPEED